MTAELTVSWKPTHKDTPCHATHRVNKATGRSSGRVAGVVKSTGEETWSPIDVFKIMCNETVAPDGSEHSLTVDSAIVKIADATRIPDFEYAAADILRYDHEGMLKTPAFHCINAQSGSERTAEVMTGA